MTITKFFLVSIIATTFVACSSDDDTTSIEPKGGAFNFEIPSTYVFDRAGNSTVSFSGQTTRLNQGSEILSDFTQVGETTLEELQSQFSTGQGFENADFNDTKNIQSKTAESVESSVDQAEIRRVFNSYIENQVTLFLGNFSSNDEVPVATRGVAGKVAGKRLVNENGLELNQAFNKGLIGALTLDQIVNDYLILIRGEAVQLANDNDELDADNSYTRLEHFWDEAYGYMYGASDADVLDNPNSRHLETVVDKFLYKYVQRVNNDVDFAGIANDIFQAYKTGRAAIVGKNYEVAEAQADIITQLLSEVVAIRAVFYLRQGAMKINTDGLDAINNENIDAFHDLSEGYGFVYSLQFTRNPQTGLPYFTKSEVDAFIARLDAADGFWTLANNTAELDALATEIAARFNFTVAQAEATTAAITQ